MFSVIVTVAQILPGQDGGLLVLDQRTLESLEVAAASVAAASKACIHSCDSFCQQDLPKPATSKLCEIDGIK